VTRVRKLHGRSCGASLLKRALTGAAAVSPHSIAGEHRHTAIAGDEMPPQA